MSLCVCLWQRERKLIMVIDHIGIVVKNLEKGIEKWSALFGYNKMTEIVVNTRQKVKIVFLTKKDSLMIKLIEPTDETSPIYVFAKKGGGLHHLCFKCEEINKGVDYFKEKGLRILADPQPGEAFESNNIAFVYAGDGLNIELIDTDIKAQRIL
jgi:methylmalonyl-CoA/ethylmalonyl-CoA epimerase